MIKRLDQKTVRRKNSAEQIRVMLEKTDVQNYQNYASTGRWRLCGQDTDII